MGKSATVRFTGIEAGRGIAATMVVFYHVSRHINKAYGSPTLVKLLQFGHSGVDFFFVISGFIILFVHYGDIGRASRLPHYLERRFTRLMPTYWVALALTILMMIAGSHRFPSLHDFFWSATLLPSNTEPLLGVAWTLHYEIVFYAVFALCIFSQRAGIALLVLWLLSILCVTVGHLRTGGLPQSLFGVYNFEFFLGMVAAWGLHHYRLPKASLVLAGGMALFASAAIGEDAGLFNGYADFSRAIYGLPSVLIILGAAEASRDGVNKVPRLLGMLGKASYSIYLFQFVFLGALWKILTSTKLALVIPHDLSFLLLSLASVAGGVLTSRYVEYPLMNFARNSIGKIRGTTPRYGAGYGAAADSEAASKSSPPV
jgi:peptidoglycan/LPS O-acetylase OafA/YrhL